MSGSVTGESTNVNFGTKIHLKRILEFYSKDGKDCFKYSNHGKPFSQCSKFGVEPVELTQFIKIANGPFSDSVCKHCLKNYRAQRKEYFANK